MGLPSGRRRRQFCVFTSAGDRNNVLSWLPKEGSRNWDLIIAFYGDSDEVYADLAKQADIIFRMKGSKFQNLKKVYTNQPGLFADYEYIWVSDDDITFRTGNLNQLFELSARFGLILCQPAFSADGRISHPITRIGEASTSARLVNFVEVTCPLFRADRLLDFLSVYDGILVGWGIDWWFCQYLGSRISYQFAIVDEVVVLNPLNHQRKGEEREISKLLGDEARKQQWIDVQERFKLSEYRQEVLANIFKVDSLEPKIKPNVTAGELRLFGSFATRSKSYLEFGIGDSTYLAAKMIKTAIISVDSSSQSVEKITKYYSDKKIKLEYKFIKVDIGPVDEWGYPVGNAHRDTWPDYHSLIWKNPLASAADLILITGRFRVACFMQSIIHGRSDVLIMIGNFAERKEYHIVHEVAREIAVADNLSVFQPSGNNAKQRAAEILQEYMFVPL